MNKEFEFFKAVIKIDDDVKVFDNYDEFVEAMESQLLQSQQNNTFSERPALYKTDEDYIIPMLSECDLKKIVDEEIKEDFLKKLENRLMFYTKKETMFSDETLQTLYNKAVSQHNETLNKINDLLRLEKDMLEVDEKFINVNLSLSIEYLKELLSFYSAMSDIIMDNLEFRNTTVDELKKNDEKEDKTAVKTAEDCQSQSSFGLEELFNDFWQNVEKMSFTKF